MDQTVLEAKNLKISYGSFSINEVSFTLNSGDRLGLIGGSGSGKSTIIKTLVGLKSRDEGSITFTLNGEERNLNDFLGYSPQYNSLYPFLTVEENILTFARLFRVDKNQAERRMDVLLKRFNLSEFKKKRITQLSGGMQKRIDLVATLIHSPRVIVLDEPFAGLDVSLQKSIWSLLLEFSEMGAIIIISSHMLTDIKNNCNQFGLVYNNTFYGTEQIMTTLQKWKDLTFENYLEKLFAKTK